MIYKWGTIKYQVDAQVAGEEVARIASVKPLTAEAIVAESTNKDAPLYPIFEWDNVKASHEWRKQQARVMLGNLVTVQIDEREVEPTRAYVNIVQDDSDYTGIDVVVKNTDLHEMLVKQAIRELAAYKKKYNEVARLRNHFAILDEFKNKALEAQHDELRTY